jgi:hypothetical protein
VKPNKVDVRIIHDFSRPNGGVNAYVEDTSVTYATIDQAVKEIGPEFFMSKCDLKSAYRSIPLHQSVFKLTGLQWHFEGDQDTTFMFDVRLPFGAAHGILVHRRFSLRRER